MTDEKKDQREEREGSQFKVDDRRIFTAEGDLRETREQQATSQESSRPEGQQVEGQQDSTQGAFAEREKRSEAPPVDFSSFLISLATTALVHLGEIPDPATGETSDNLEAGKQMIDIISVLKEKTRGNLDEDEHRLLEELLYELRMKYLARARVINV